MDTEKDLHRLREKIDTLDADLLRLINERAELAIEVGRVKRLSGIPADFYRPEREAEILRRVRETNPGPLRADESVRLMRELMSACLALEQPLKVAYLGPAGTFTHLAALKHFGHSVTAIPVTAIGEVMREVEAGGCEYGVVPVENSLEGGVNQTLDGLRGSSLRICGEVVMNVRHQLLTCAPTLSQIRRVYAHEQALAQCRRWLGAHLPQAEMVPSSSNAEAATRARDEHDAAAIAGQAAASLYELPILASNIEDHSDNTTRFLVLGKRSPAATGEDITALMFSMPNRPGALYHILQALADANISMTRIESRPMRNGTWDYLFFVDIAGHIDDDNVATALQQVRERASVFKVLGSFPRAAT